MKKILIFIGLTYGLAWGIWLIAYLMGRGLNVLVLVLAMFAPALAFLVLRIFSKGQVELGADFRLHLRESWGYFLLALWGPAILTVLAYLLYFLAFPKEFVLSSSVFSLAKKAGVPASLIILSSLFRVLTLGPLINTFVAIGEEIGWRGYLFPTLKQQFSPWSAHLLVGLIWSLWHLPINLQGYNYGLAYADQPWLGILAMFLFCFGLSVCLSYLVEKTGSIWSAALLHGSLNGWASFTTLFDLKANHLILGPFLNGLISCLPLLVLAIYLLNKERGTAYGLRWYF